VLTAQAVRFFSTVAHTDWAASFARLKKQVCTFVWCVRFPAGYAVLEICTKHP